MEQNNADQKNEAVPIKRRLTSLRFFLKDNPHLFILGVTVLVILFLIFGSLTRFIQGMIFDANVADASIASEANAMSEWEEEISLLTEEAIALARHFDYEAAVKLMNTFTGDMEDFPEFHQLYKTYNKAMDDLVLWSDPDDIVNLSFQVLIADPQRAFSNPNYANTFSRNFITVTEFTAILQQLYRNDYILVSLADFATSNGAKGLYLPKGKKPLVITQTNVNYNYYLIDSNNDYLPDSGGGGFASKLVLDANGNITCEMIDASGNTVYGQYDIVPLLDAFVETHPDFSYKGAKAVIALTGSEGVFGYRTEPSASERLGTIAYQQEIANASKVAQALRETGYELACYSFSNQAYTELSTDQVEGELIRWNNDVYPIVGFTNIFVFCQSSDLAPTAQPYADERFSVLYKQGFRYFLGFCEDGLPWFSSPGKYMRQGRILVSGYNLTHNSEWFNGLFQADMILDRSRPSN